MLKIKLILKDGYIIIYLRLLMYYTNKLIKW